MMLRSWQAKMEATPCVTRFRISVGEAGPFSFSCCFPQRQWSRRIDGAPNEGSQANAPKLLDDCFIEVLVARIALNDPRAGKYSAAREHPAGLVARERFNFLPR